GRVEEAAGLAEEARRLQPRSGEVLNLVAGVHASRADAAGMRPGGAREARKAALKAASAVIDAIKLRPDDPALRFNLVKLLRGHLGGRFERHAEALKHARVAVRLRSDDVSYGLLLLEQLGDSAKQMSWTSSLDLDAIQSDLEGFVALLKRRANLGTPAGRVSRHDFYHHWFRAVQFASTTLQDAALAADICLTAARAMAPSENGEALFHWATLVPAVFSSQQHVDETLSELHRRLSWLESEAVAGRAQVNEADEAGGPELLSSPPSCFLGYLGGNQLNISRRAASALKALAPSRLLQRAPHAASLRGGPPRGVDLDGCAGSAAPRGGRPRVGFLWGFGQQHAVSRAVDWMVTRLDPERRDFEVHLLLLDQAGGAGGSGPAEAVLKAAEHAVRVPRRLPEARAILAGLRLDVLVLPELGLDPVRYVLAFGRWAPVQVVAVLGHPLSSAAEGVDYAVSSAAFEVPGAPAQELYAEELVRLPGLPPLERSPEVLSHRVSVPRDELLRTVGLDWLARAEGGQGDGAEADFRLYLLPKSRKKLHPGFDAALRGILEADVGAVLVVLAQSDGEPAASVEGELLARLRAAGVPCGADDGERRRCAVKAGYLNTTAFLSWMQHADALLESAPFGGFTATLQGLQLGRPWVVLRDVEGPSSGIMSAALQEAVGLSECCVADGLAEYVRKATDLARDRGGVRSAARAACAARVSAAELGGEPPRSAVGRTGRGGDYYAIPNNRDIAFLRQVLAGRSARAEGGGGAADRAPAEDLRLEALLAVELWLPLLRFLDPEGDVPSDAAAHGTLVPLLRLARVPAMVAGPSGEAIAGEVAAALQQLAAPRPARAGAVARALATLETLAERHAALDTSAGGGTAQEVHALCAALGGCGALRGQLEALDDAEEDCLGDLPAGGSGAARAGGARLPPAVRRRAEALLSAWGAERRRLVARWQARAPQAPTASPRQWARSGLWKLEALSKVESKAHAEGFDLTWLGVRLEVAALNCRQAQRQQKHIAMQLAQDEQRKKELFEKLDESIEDVLGAKQELDRLQQELLDEPSKAKCAQVVGLAAQAKEVCEVRKNQDSTSLGEVLAASADGEMELDGAPNWWAPRALQKQPEGQ
ncbi:unnamed protein product, partial [Prorocentrum cordatum]